MATHRRDRNCRLEDRWGCGPTVKVWMDRAGRPSRGAAWADASTCPTAPTLACESPVQARRSRVSAVLPARAPRRQGISGHHAESSTGIVQRAGVPTSDPVATWLAISSLVSLDELVVAADHLVLDPYQLDPRGIRSRSGAIRTSFAESVSSRPAGEWRKCERADYSRTRMPRCVGCATHSWPVAGLRNPRPGPSARPARSTTLPHAPLPLHACAALRDATFCCSLRSLGQK